MSPSALEMCALEKIKLACANSPFDAKDVELVSGQRFPDIVANSYYGIEVKSTKADHWTSTGSSIVESTRIENVDDIYMLFGKLGGKVPMFKCRPYQDVLYDIAVTHSPRYLIDMELNSQQTIFSKMGTTYDDFRKSPKAIQKVRTYYREQAKLRGKQEMPWWITSENVDVAKPFNIRLWNSLDIDEKRLLQAKCMILFPEALSSKKSRNKYNNTTLWLCSYCQVVNPNVRDMYSAGGQITHVNGKRLQRPVPQVFNIIVEYAEFIRKLLAEPTADFLQMIEEYNPILMKGEDLYKEWINMCCDIVVDYNIPLKEWIDTKPIFAFSK